MRTATAKGVMAALEMTTTVADAIRELKQVPAGELYANLMGHISHHQFEQIVDILVRANVVSRKSHLLTWIGGQIAKEPSSNKP